MPFLLSFLAYVFSFSLIFNQDPDVSELRALLYKGSEDENKADLLLQKVGKYNGSNALVIGYKGAAYALHAKHAFNPMSKLKNINKAQEFFNEAVTKAPQDLEVRFLRYSVEAQTPAFLNLSHHVAEDQVLLLQGLRNYPRSGFSPVTARIARDYLVLYCTCTEKEKEFLANLKL